MQQHQHQVIQDIGTDVIIQWYNDRTMVLVTQLGKVGNLVLLLPPRQYEFMDLMILA